MRPKAETHGLSGPEGERENGEPLFERIVIMVEVICPSFVHTETLTWSFHQPECRREGDDIPVPSE